MMGSQKLIAAVFVIISCFNPSAKMVKSWNPSLQHVVKMSFNGGKNLLTEKGGTGGIVKDHY